MTTIDDKNDDIQIIEEDEEVLVDDFDGQCCRTYPYNHSKILRWREERRKREEERRSKETKQEAEGLKHVPIVKQAPPSTYDNAVLSCKPGETITTTAGKAANNV